ncbi:Uncharacterized protein DAT39_018876, partial [Clarias magur]
MEHSVDEDGVEMETQSSDVMEGNEGGAALVESKNVTTENNGVEIEQTGPA